MNTVFIYTLCEPGTRTVRYIGRTTSLKNRMRQHLKDSAKLDSPLGMWLRSLSAPPNLVKLCETSEAFWEDDEKMYIRSARALGMPLVNSTDGGECCIKTPELCAKLSASKSTPEARAKTSEQAKARWASPVFRAKMSAVKATPESSAKASVSVKARWEAPGARAELSEKLKLSKSTPEAREKLSLSATERWSDEANREAQSERTKAAWADPETRAALDSPEARARQRAGISAAHSRPESRVKRSEKMKLLWADPVWRAARLETRKKNKNMRGEL